MHQVEQSQSIEAGSCLESEKTSSFRDEKESRRIRFEGKIYFFAFFVLVGDRNDGNQQYVNLLEDGTATQESFVSQLPSQFQNRYTPQGHEQEESGGKEIK